MRSNTKIASTDSYMESAMYKIESAVIKNMRIYGLQRLPLIIQKWIAGKEKEWNR